MKQCTIAIVTPTTRASGGVEVFNTYLARALRDRGHNVDIISKESLCRLPLSRVLFKRYRLERLLGAAFNIINLWRSFDVVICNGEYARFVKHPRAVMVFHGCYYGYAQAMKSVTTSEGYRSLIRLAESQRLASLGKQVVAVSGFVATALAEQGIEVDSVIPNCVDINLFTPDSHVPIKNECLYVGRYDYFGKGFDVLEKLAEGGLHIRCVTDLRPESQLLAWSPFVKQSELPSFYRRSACLLFPSRFEGMPLVPLEAMACGCPIVMSEVGLGIELQREIPEFVVSGEPASRVDLYRKRADALMRSRRHWSTLAREYVTEYHNFERFSSRWNQLVLNRQGGGKDMFRSIESVRIL